MEKVIERSEDLVILIIIVAVLWLVLQIKNMFFKRVVARRNDLKTRFFNHMASAMIVVIGILLVLSVFGGIRFMWRSLLGGTAFVSAIIVFTAQDVIKDSLAGLMISMFQPFEIGDRIELEDGTSGIVEDVTIRHTVLIGLDTLRFVIPNRRLAEMKITNFSYGMDLRSIQFAFEVAYPTDVEFAMRVIRRAVMESDYSLPGPGKDKGPEYRPVYFMSFQSSSLLLKTTVYFSPSIPTEVVISDINVRVDRALWENGIEIPYPHINVLQTGEEVKDHRPDEAAEMLWRTSVIRVTHSGKEIHQALDATMQLGEENGLSHKQCMRLRLLGEELLRLMPAILGNVEVRYWAEHKKRAYRIHVSTDVAMNREIRARLLSVSSTGRNAASQSFTDKIRVVISTMLIPEEKEKYAKLRGIAQSGGGDNDSMDWSLKEYETGVANGTIEAGETPLVRDELEKSIIARVADDVSISIRGFSVEIIAFKEFKE